MNSVNTGCIYNREGMYKNKIKTYTRDIKKIERPISEVVTGGKSCNLYLERWLVYTMSSTFDVSDGSSTTRNSRLRCEAIARNVL